MLTIKYRHYRLADKGQLSPTGGFTLALHRTATTAFVGSAKCSKHDKYCKQTGRDIAYRRLKLLDERLVITEAELRDFLYSKRITLEGFTANATTKFINSVQLDDITDELIFQYALILARPLT